MKTATPEIQPLHFQPSLFHREGRALEHYFPIRELSLLAKQESWRKEVNRPLYHIHKWWAQRLGSVFRAIILGALSDAPTDIWSDFYRQHNFSGKIVLDPFMGSGTTLGEAAKLGAKPIGIDINPISSFIVKQSLTRVDLIELERTFHEIETDVKSEITQYYQTLDPETGKPIPVLYSFWVKQVQTPDGQLIPLFSSFVFSKDAYPKKKPLAKIICPVCWEINQGRYDTTDLECAFCQSRFNPQTGPVQGQYVVSGSGIQYRIKELVASDTKPPAHKFYAVMALREDGTKIYLKPGKYDLQLFNQAQRRLQTTSLPLPDMPIRPGHNTNQARGYNYLNWRDFFNDRQLLCLGILFQRILQIPSQTIREQFICLFSSILEFNNLFCTFKGEGTGAVRPLFSHHILKPERTPLENSVWGTDKSSGTFLTLFRSRLMKAKLYLEFPFELKLASQGGDPAKSNDKIVCSTPIKLTVTEKWEEFIEQPDSALILNGNGADLPLPDQCVDTVITDPPYFDFVHYSELSDFFYAWLAPVLKQQYPYFAAPNSASHSEVQSCDVDEFTTRLTQVFRECHRVLKKEGLLSFSFHHSRLEGWLSIYKAVYSAGFQIVAVHPIYGEMQGGNPKTSAKEPILLDAILVCKKIVSVSYQHAHIKPDRERVAEIVEELSSMGLVLSRADLFVIEIAHLLVTASKNGYTPEEASEFFKLRLYNSCPPTPPSPL